MPLPARLLIIRFSSIGDIVLTTPVIRILKNQLEGEVEIFFLTKKKYASLLEGNPHITKVFTIEKSVQEALPEIKEAGIDYVVDLHRNIRSYIVKRKLGVLNYTFRKLNFQKWLLVNFGINLLPEKNIAERYIDAVKPFGVSDDGKGLEFYIPARSRVSMADLPASHIGGFVSVVIGGTHTGKKMGREKLRNICQAIPFPVVLLGGEKEADMGEFIAANQGTIYNAVNKFNIHQSADIVRQSRVVVTGDTGLMHIAAAFHKKIISVWGCTVPAFGMYPYHAHPDSVMIEPVHLKRRPCSKLGNHCKYGMKNRCINQVDNDLIVDAVKKLWDV